MTKPIIFSAPASEPYLIAGPCTAESAELMTAVAEAIAPLARELGCRYIFKASFDKANRTAGASYRGPGLKQALKWFADLKQKLGVAILTDIHESHQIPEAAELCEVLQIPAFLCRQTDLVTAAVSSGRAVNVKKGQFLSPYQARHLVDKARIAAKEKNLVLNLALTERGASFGYGNLVVDLRSFPIMAQTGVPILFDITHSTQMADGDQGAVQTGGAREFAPVLARGAAASGYISGFFLEVHTDPKSAKSDAKVQLSIDQARSLLKQVIPLWREASQFAKIDKAFS